MQDDNWLIYYPKLHQSHVHSHAMVFAVKIAHVFSDVRQIRTSDVEQYKSVVRHGNGLLKGTPALSLICSSLLSDDC